jgi:hypothetical protein
MAEYRPEQGIRRRAARVLAGVGVLVLGGILGLILGVIASRLALRW